MAAQDVPLPPDPVPPEVILAQGQREQVEIGRGQLQQLNTIGHLLGTQNAQASLTKYSGDPKKFQDWIRSLEKYQLLVGRSQDHDKKAFALHSAEGPVSDFLVRYFKTNPLSTWTDVLNELKARFDDIVDRQHGLQVLRTTKQKKDETIQVFAERLLYVAEQAWPGEDLNQVLIQRQILDIFVDGIMENQIARKVLRENPNTLSAAVKIAVDEQNLTRKFQLRNRVVTQPKTVSRLKTDKFDRTTDRVEVPMEVDTFQGRCFKCHKQGHRAVNCRQKKVHEVKTGSRLICYRCGEPGHGLKTCQNQGKPETGRCWHCGSPDHKRATCPKRPIVNTDQGHTDNPDNQEN